MRDQSGKGVLTGLTNISKIVAFEEHDGIKEPCEGQLWYRGYSVESLVRELNSSEFGFESTAYLLLFGEKPGRQELEEFRVMLSKSRNLPTNFTRDVIMKAPGKDIMNSMTRSILTLASYDERANSAEIEDSLRQCIQLISIMSMLRPDKKYTQLEAKVLDIALMRHMEHGGANIKVMEDIRSHVRDHDDMDEIKNYLSLILDKKAFDKKGLIYGMGHAVYSLSDPQERIFKGFVEKLAVQKR